MNEKIKIVVLYQVIMHYRIPFYERIANDEKFDFTIFFGNEDKGTKLVNANILDTKIESKKLFSFRIPFKTNNGTNKIQISPFLFFELLFYSPQIVFSEGSSSIINSSVAFIYAKIFRKKFVWWSLGMLKNREYTGLRKWINKWEKIIENNSDAIFTYSNQGKNYFLERGVQNQRIFVAVNVLDTNKKLSEIQEFKDRSSYTDFENFFNISFIGSITKEKKLELLIDTFEKFNQKYPNKGKLHIIGDGIHLPEIKKYVKGKALDSLIIFHGRINRGANVILQHCQVMVLPGLGGLAICEGMLNALPIITGTADGTELDLVDETNGFVLSKLTESILFEKIELLFLKPLLRMEMGEKSFEKITTIYSFDNYYKMFEQAIRFLTK